MPTVTLILVNWFPVMNFVINKLNIFITNLAQKLIICHKTVLLIYLSPIANLVSVIVLIQLLYLYAIEPIKAIIQLLFLCIRIVNLKFMCLLWRTQLKLLTFWVVCAWLSFKSYLVYHFFCMIITIKELLGV